MFDSHYWLRNLWCHFSGGLIANHARTAESWKGAGDISTASLSSACLFIIIDNYHWEYATLQQDCLEIWHWQSHLIPTTLSLSPSIQPYLPSQSQFSDRNGLRRFATVPIYPYRWLKKHFAMFCHVDLEACLVPSFHSSGWVDIWFIKSYVVNSNSVIWYEGVWYLRVQMSLFCCCSLIFTLIQSEGQLTLIDVSSLYIHSAYRHVVVYMQ